MLETGRSYRPVGICQDTSGAAVSAYLLYGLIISSVIFYVIFSVKHVTVEMDGKRISFYTFAEKASDVLKDVGFTGQIVTGLSHEQVNEGREVLYWTMSQDLNSKIHDDTKLKIYRNGIRKFASERYINPPVKREWDIFMESGTQRIIKPGRKGVIKDTWVKFYKDGVLIKKFITESRLLSPPSPIIIASGSYETASRQGMMQGGHPLKFLATAYTYTGYRTAVGAKTRRGIIAVDPKVIPLGTRLYVQGYGYGVAADTGGLIKGRRLDLFVNSEKEAVKWGKRSVNVYLLSPLK